MRLLAVIACLTGCIGIIPPLVSDLAHSADEARHVNTAGCAGERGISPMHDKWPTRGNQDPLFRRADASAEERTLRDTDSVHLVLDAVYFDLDGGTR